MKVCTECGSRLMPHPYAKHADDSRVLVCPNHGDRDSLTTESGTAIWWLARVLYAVGWRKRRVRSIGMRWWQR
jgi:hypothetical protein